MRLIGNYDGRGHWWVTGDRPTATGHRGPGKGGPPTGTGQEGPGRGDRVRATGARGDGGLG